jgi:hypothetical protein
MMNMQCLNYICMCSMMSVKGLHEYMCCLTTQWHTICTSNFLSINKQKKALLSPSVSYLTKKATSKACAKDNNQE